MNRFDELWIGNKQYFVISHLNSGNSYSILKVQDTVGNKYYLTIIDHIDDVQTKLIQILQKQHKNIVSLIQIGQVSKYKYILSEYIEIDLYTELKKKLIGKQDFRYIMASISDGIKFLHDNNIIHKNLKPESIFIQQIKINSQTQQNVYKIGNLPIINCLSSPFFMPPEVIKNQGYDKSIDVWALGAIAYEIFEGKPLFNGQNPEQLQQLILQQTDESIREKLKILPVEYQPIIQKILSINPQLRPDIKDVLKVFRMTSKSPQRIQTPKVLNCLSTIVNDILIKQPNFGQISQTRNLAKISTLIEIIQTSITIDTTIPINLSIAQIIDTCIAIINFETQTFLSQSKTQLLQLIIIFKSIYQKLIKQLIQIQKSFEEDNHYRPPTFGLQQ